MDIKSLLDKLFCLIWECGKIRGGEKYKRMLGVGVISFIDQSNKGCDPSWYVKLGVQEGGNWMRLDEDGAYINFEKLPFGTGGYIRMGYDGTCNWNLAWKRRKKERFGKLLRELYAALNNCGKKVVIVPDMYGVGGSLVL